jgi:imidazolonepropionase-like amidohydrolase
LASNPPDTMPLRRRIESGELKGPRVYTAGRALFPPRPGLPFYLSDLPRNLLDQMQQPSTPAEAREDVEKNFAGGSDLLKLFTGSIVAKGTVKPMPLDIARAVVGVAHQRHTLVFAHPSNLEGATIALESGVDVLAHAPSYPQGIDRAFLQRVVDHHMAMVPTLKMFSTTVRSADDYMLPIVNEVRSFHELGGELLFGTDVGYMHDYSTDEEFRRLAQAGLSASDILRMLTLAPAARFGVSGHTGTIAAGKDGDLTILDADPAQDSMNFARVRCTIRQGQVIWGNCKPEEHRKLKR